MLSEADLSKFSAATLSLYRPGLCLENFAERSFEFLNHVVASEFVAFGSLDTATQQLDIGFDKPVESFPKAMEAFAALMGEYDLFKWDPQVNAGKPFKRSDYFSKRQFRQLDIYNEVYAVLGIDNHLAVHVPTRSDEVAFFGIERKGGPDFSEEERVMLGLAQSHLGNARELVKARLVEGEEGPRPEVLTKYGLTTREADVLSWIAEGKSNEEISIILQIGLYTVKGYAKSIFQKIAAPNRLAAALWALRISRIERARAASSPESFVKVPVPVR